MKILALFLLTLGSIFAEDTAKMRNVAEGLETSGNWREAYETRLELLREADDPFSGNDLTKAIQSQNQLGLQEELDPLLAELTASKQKNAAFMLAAGNAFLQSQHYGRILDNEFRRGNRGSGDYRNVSEQDRASALQCYMQAWKSVEKGGQKELEALQKISAALITSRTGGSLWKLYQLTDLTQKPDYTEQTDQISSSGAPVAENGEPQWIDLPKSWETATSDGERWRWISQKISEINPAAGLQKQFRWLQFCQNNYGVQTLASYSWWSSPDVEERDGLLQASSLAETETIAKLANGIKRFTLRADYQYIPAFRELMRTGKTAPSAKAGDSLVQIFLNRNQYIKAAETLEELIKIHGEGGGARRSDLLKQIRGNWSQFGPTDTFYAKGEVEIPYTFRNASEVSLSLFSVNETAVMADIIKYLEKNPAQINGNKANFSNLGRRLISEEKSEYADKKLRSWKEKLTPKAAHQNTQTQLKLGTLAPGCYLLKSSMEGGNTSWTVVWVRDLIILKRDGDDTQDFYLVDATSGQPVAGELEFFGYRTEYVEKKKQNRRFNVETYRFTRKTDAEGRLTLREENKFWDNAQWHIIATSGQRRAYLTGSYLRWNSLGDSSAYHSQKTIGITDRPVYRPGQKVHVKLWAGESRYDLGEISTYAGKSVDIEIRDARREVVFKKNGLITDSYGGLTFELDLEEEATLGNYQVLVRGGIPTTIFTFRVEEYKKPEYQVKVEAPDTPVALGESFEATVLASYYHGAPLTDATVKIKVERNFFNNRWFPAAEWDWLYGAGYWWAYGEYSWYPGWARWGCIRPAPPWWQGRGRSGAPELILEQASPIGPDGKVNVTIDSSIAKLIHGDQDHTYSITAEVVDASRRTIVGTGSVLASRQPFTVTTWLDRGYATIGDTVTASFSARTLDGKTVKGTSTATLYRAILSEAGEIEEEQINQWTPEATSWDFSASKPGQYRISVRFTDKKGRTQEGATVFSVRGPDGETEGNFRTNALELIPDKNEYRPGETVKLLINIDQADSRVWLFIRPSQGNAAETKIIQISGKSQIIEIPITLRDMPNFFIEAVTINKGEVISTTQEIILPPEKRKLNVEVTPAKDRLKPGEKTTFTIRITDSEGQPYQGSAAISVYDKSLEYISGGSNVAEIVPFFWNWKRNYYSPGMENSQNLFGDHLQMPRTQFMQWLGLNQNNDPFSGGLSLLRPRQMMKSDGMVDSMVLAEDADFGASSDEGAPLKPESENNPQPAPEIIVRSEFKDLLKWVGSVETDETGQVTIDLEMPDNLTTWKIKTWAMGRGTRVGEGSAEIVTSKDLIVRLQAPRFFIEKDQVTLSAIVHNYHTTAKDVTISLELDGENLTAPASTLSRRVAIPAGGETRIDWPTSVKKEGEVTIRMKAITADDSDAMEMKFPVYIHGMAKTESFSTAISPEGDSAEINFTIPAERRPSESEFILNYSPSVAAAMVDALPYLASYPHGCTEQTLNRFVPTTVVHRLLKDLGHDLAAIKTKRTNLNPQQIGSPQERAKTWKPNHADWNPVWDAAEIAKMESAGIAKLHEQQNPDGGWGWFSAYGTTSYPHTTTVVIHGLLLAQKNGAKIPQEMLTGGLTWLEEYEKTEIAKIKNHGQKNNKPKKQKADAIDAFIRHTLGNGGKYSQQMLTFLFRDKNELPIYGKSLLGLELHRTKDLTKRDEVIRNIRQYLKRDPENQTTYLDLPNRNYWWNWYGSEFESQAWFLKLLTAAEPKSPDTRGLVKYLINNRSNTTHWDSTRDTAYCLEAIADYLRASGEGDPNITLEILLDGKSLKTVEITKENLFSYDHTLRIGGDILTSGQHQIEIRKTGQGPIYANAYLEYFTLEDFIPAAGLEIKIDRTFYKLTPETKDITAVDSTGQAIAQKRAKLKRIPLKNGDQIQTGDLIEVELGIDSKNDYEYLHFQDWKAAGLEAVELTSGYNPNGLGAYMELRDEAVSLFVQNLPRGRHNLSYRLRAEIPGTFSALPTKAEAMYAPELKANSQEMKITITD